MTVLAKTHEKANYAIPHNLVIPGLIDGSMSVDISSTYKLLITQSTDPAADSTQNIGTILKRITYGSEIRCLNLNNIVAIESWYTQ
jgi:hypothetical protein